MIDFAALIGVAAISDSRLGGLYRDWLSLRQYESAKPSAERLAQYAGFACQLLAGDDPLNLAGDFARFCRVWLVGAARGLSLQVVKTAFDTGRDFPPAEVREAIQQRQAFDGWSPCE